jgi:hypothetical protein
VTVCFTGVGNPFLEYVKSVRAALLSVLGFPPGLIAYRTELASGYDDFGGSRKTNFTLERMNIEITPRRDHNSVNFLPLSASRRYI